MPINHFNGRQLSEQRLLDAFSGGFSLSKTVKALNPIKEPAYEHPASEICH